MEVAKISVTENRAIVLSRKPITSGMVGATVAFDFDASWNDLSKTYVWKANDVTLDDTDATGKVPRELLIPGAQLTVGVYGVSEGKVIPTLWADLGMVMPGADPSGDESSDPSLPVWAQLQQDIEELQQGGGDGTGSAVLYTEQNLTPEQQAQARENIGAVAESDINSIVDAKLSSITNAEEVAY